MRRQTLKQKSEGINKRKVSNDRRERLRIEYLAEKEQRENQPDEKYSNKVRLVVQAATKRDDEAYKALIASMQILMDDTIAIIVEKLKEYEDDIRDVPDEIIKKVLDDTALAIKRLQKDCADPKYVARLNPSHPSIYEKLFIQLIDKVDVRFALYAPQRSLIKTSYRFERLSKENKEILFNRLVEFGLFNNETYLERYSYAFSEQLKDNNAYQL